MVAAWPPASFFAPIKLLRSVQYIVWCDVYRRVDGAVLELQRHEQLRLAAGDMAANALRLPQSRDRHVTTVSRRQKGRTLNSRGLLFTCNLYLIAGRLDTGDTKVMMKQMSRVPYEIRTQSLIAPKWSGTRLKLVLPLDQSLKLHHWLSIDFVILCFLCLSVDCTSY